MVRSSSPYAAFTSESVTLGSSAMSISPNFSTRSGSSAENGRFIKMSSLDMSFSFAASRSGSS